FQAIERRFYYLTGETDKGSFTFAPTFTAACPDGNAACAAARNTAGLNAGGNAFASYLLGLPNNLLVQLNAAPYRGNRRQYCAYAQDSWRINARLTLNYGIRYEYWAPWRVPRHTLVTFNEVTGKVQYVLQNPLDYLDPAKGYGKSAPQNPEIPSTGYSTSALNFGPRVGFAYSLTSKTVFRAGYGLYWDGNMNMNQFQDISSAIGPFRLRYEAVTSSGDQLPSLQVSGNFPQPGPT